MDGRGAAVVVWGGTAFRAARRPAGSETWEQPMTVRPIPACFGRDLAVDPMGNAVAVWNSSSQVGSELYAAVLDATPPILQRLVIPHVAHSRSKVRFAVAASDVWSDLATPPLWSFGDGGTAHGITTQHIYRRPGRYRVRVTARDHVGNTTTTTATIRVTRKR